jgi:hypothetical protein
MANDADTVTISAPLNKDKVEIQKLVLGKASWILKKQREYKYTIPQITKPSFRGGGNPSIFGLQLSSKNR